MLRALSYVNIYLNNSETKLLFHFLMAGLGAVITSNTATGSTKNEC